MSAAIISYEHTEESGECLLTSWEQDKLLEGLGIWPCDSTGKPYTMRVILSGDWWPDLNTADLLSRVGVVQ